LTITPCFPKRVGIIFTETTSKKGTILDFDQDACTFFLLQMNRYQRTFEFQIFTPINEPPQSNKGLEAWFVQEVKNFENLEKNSNWETRMSPPSLFEFIAVSVYTCALQCLSLEFSNEKYDHENIMRGYDQNITRGCISNSGILMPCLLLPPAAFN
jgi:hypothetical protein